MYAPRVVSAGAERYTRTGSVINKDKRVNPVMRRTINLDKFAMAWLPMLINAGNFSANKASPWTSHNFSHAKEGPKSGYLSLASEMTRARNSDVKALLGRCPRRQETSP